MIIYRKSMLGIKKLKRYVSFLNRNSQTIYDSTDHSSVIRDVCLMKLPRVPLCNILKTKIHMYFFSIICQTLKHAG